MSGAPESSSDWSDFLVEDQRLCVLRSLSELGGYTANDSSLRTELCARFGHDLSRSKVREIVHWLFDHGLVDVKISRSAADPAFGDAKESGLWICTLTGLGADIASGRETKKGVGRMSPG